MNHPFILYTIITVFLIFYLKQAHYYGGIEDALKHDAFLWDYMRRTNSGLTAIDLHLPRNCVIPMNRVYYPIYPIAPSNSLSACVIPKNMSTVLTAILCLLFDPSKWQSTGRNLTLDVDRPCRNLNELHRVSQLKKLAGDLGSWTNLMLVREPTERFLSGFLYMCARDSVFPGSCFGCDEDVLCVLRKLYELSSRFSRGDLSADGNELWHLGPQNWHCEYFSEPELFKVVRYSPSKKKELVKELMDVLIGSRVDSAIVEMIVSQIMTQTTPHTTHNRNKSLKQKAKEQLETWEGKQLMKKIFYWDYVLFGFPMPS